MSGGDGSTTEGSAASQSDILVTVVTALHELAREPDVDWDLEVFDVARLDGGEPLAGVVMNSTREVAFYAVRPQFVPAAARMSTAEFITRENTRLTTAAFELDLDTGILSLRAGFAFPETDLGLVAVQAIVERLLNDVEDISRRTEEDLERAIAAASQTAVEPS